MGNSMGLDGAYSIRVEWLQQLFRCCQEGEGIYKALLASVAEDTELLFAPADLRDTLWLCGFASAYKNIHGHRLALASRASQAEAVVLFPAIDQYIPLEEEQVWMLRCFIVLRERWVDARFRYGYPREVFAYAEEADRFAVQWLPAEPACQSGASLFRRVLDLPPDTEADALLARILSEM